MLKKVDRQWDWVAGVCLILIVFISAYSLELTYWTYDLNSVTILALLGLGIGLIIGLSSFPEKFALFLAGLYGCVFIFLQLVISLDNSVLWIERFVAYFLRFSKSINQLTRNIPLEDGILFLTIAGILYCFLSINLGFRFIRKNNNWVSFGIIILFYYLIQFYLPTSQRNYALISIFSLLTIIYLGRQFYLTRKSRWDRAKIKADTETSAYFTKLIIIFTLILVMVAWGIPLIIQKFSGERAAAVQSQRTLKYSSSWELLRNFFYPLRQQSGFGEGYLPEILALGNSRSLKDDEAFIASAPDDYSYPYRYYWKGRVYDFYENGLWQTKAAEIQLYLSVEINPYQAQSTPTGLFSFIYKYPRETILTPQIAIKVEHQGDLAFFPTGEDTQDILSIVDNQLIHSDEQVDVWGAFYNPDWQILVDSPEELPQWVSSKYLQLPVNFSKKAASLAWDISSEKRTRIEKAVAITNYLRNTFRYKDFVDIPQGSDPIDWFLFEGREGFCNYFSTADVLMLRSIGIPARMVVGYAQGERISENNEFLVRIKDSHSWVEAFFPDSGWVILEPTPSQPDIILNKPIENLNSKDLGRIEKLTLEETTQPQNPELEFFSAINKRYGISTNVVQTKANISRINIAAWITGLGIIIFGVVSIIYGIFLRKKPISFPVIIEKNLTKKGKNIPAWLKKWADYEKLPGFEKAYQNIRLLSRLLLFRMEKYPTPKEYFEKLSTTLKADDQTARLFMDQYQLLAYSRKYDKSTESFYQLYIHILGLILGRWKEKRIEDIKFRINLVKIR